MTVSPQSTRAAPEKSPYRAFYWILIAMALVGIAGLAYSVVRARAGRVVGTEPVKMDSTNLRAIYAQAKPEKLGKDDAPAKLVIFADYTCPFCGKWAAEIQPRLVQDFVNPGKLQIMYYDFPLGNEGEHKYSFLAARAGRCAGEQGKFWEMHDRLFGTQEDWTYASSAPVKTFEDLARKAGVDGAKFDACLESEKYSDVVTADRLLGAQLLVNATPTVIINELKVGDPGDYDTLRRLIEQSAGAPSATTTPATTTPALPVNPPTSTPGAAATGAPGTTTPAGAAGR